MTASAKCTQEAPGTNVKAKSGLNYSILATGWAEIEQMLAYKTRVAYVNPPFTSQRGSCCGHVDAKSRTTQAVVMCTSCGYEDHADLNAANTILSWSQGLGLLHRERRSQGRPLLSVKLVGSADLWQAPTSVPYLTFRVNRRWGVTRVTLLSGHLEKSPPPVRATLLAHVNPLHNWLSYGERLSQEEDCQIF